MFPSSGKILASSCKYCRKRKHLVRDIYRLYQTSSVRLSSNKHGSSILDAINSIPVLYLRASGHFDVGQSIGSTFKGWINEYLKQSDDVSYFRKFSRTDTGQQLIQNYLTTAERSHPHFVAEIRGIANGADASFDDIFLLQLASEIIYCHGPDVLGFNLNQKNSSKGCTDLLLNGTSLRAIGHNEDWASDVASCSYIVHVTLESEESTHILEQYLSFMYPGFLPGFAFGMNKDLVISLNSLKPLTANKSSVPLSILLRSLLSCKSIAECVATMQNKPVGCAFGMNINIGAIHTTEMCSLEVHPDKDKTVVSTYHIPTTGSCFYHHENHYKHIEIIETDVAGSRLREKRVNEMAVPKTLDDVRHILGDTLDKVEPIYRHPSMDHIDTDAQTAATAIFDISNKLLHVYRTNPRLAPSPCVSLPFLT